MRAVPLLGYRHGCGCGCGCLCPWTCWCCHVWGWSACHCGRGSSISGGTCLTWAPDQFMFWGQIAYRVSESILSHKILESQKGAGVGFMMTRDREWLGPGPDLFGSSAAISARTRRSISPRCQWPRHAAWKATAAAVRTRAACLRREAACLRPPSPRARAWMVWTWATPEQQKRGSASELDATGEFMPAAGQTRRAREVMRCCIASCSGSPAPRSNSYSRVSPRLLNLIPQH